MRYADLRRRVTALAPVRGVDKLIRTETDRPTETEWLLIKDAHRNKLCCNYIGDRCRC
jgi:hypothetical protein